MKKLFKLILLEAGFLKKTLIVISIVLTAFTAALLAVLSVMLDSYTGMIAGIDARKKSYYTNYGGESFAVTIYDTSFEDAEQYGAEMIYGIKSGVTYDTEIVSERGVFQTDDVTMLGEVSYTTEYHGYAVTTAGAQLLKKVIRFNGEVGENGIFLSRDCARQLQVGIGDTVQINDSSYTVLSIYSKRMLSRDYEFEDVVFPNGYYFVVQSTDSVVYDKVYLTSHSSENLYSLWRSLNRHGVENEIHGRMQESFDNIALVETFYGSLGVLLAALVLFIMYSLFALFYRERKAQICRFKLLGATDNTVAGIYCAIAVVLIVITIIFATVISVYMSNYLLDICTDLFNAPYVYNFRLWLPFSVFGVLVAMAVVMFLLMGRRISRAPVAEEVRSE